MKQRLYLHLRKYKIRFSKNENYIFTHILLLKVRVDKKIPPDHQVLDPPFTQLGIGVNCFYKIRKKWGCQRGCESQWQFKKDKFFEIISKTLK